MFLVVAVIVGGAFVWWLCMRPANRIATATSLRSLLPTAGEGYGNRAGSLTAKTPRTPSAGHQIRI
jgi:hypothetical protein